MERPEKVEKLERAISYITGVSVCAIRSRRRHEKTVEARHAIWVFLFTRMNYSGISIARMYGRTHDTVYRIVKRKKDETRIQWLCDLAVFVFSGRFSLSVHTRSGVIQRERYGNK